MNNAKHYRQSSKRSRQQLRKLQQEASDLFDRLQNSGGLRAIEGHELGLGIMASWCRYVQHAVNAICLLHDQSLGVYAAPIRRNIIEHAVSAYGLAQEPDALDAYARALQHTVRRTADALAAASMDSNPDMAAILNQEINDSNKHLDATIKARQKFEAMGQSGQRLYVQWLHETLLSHPTFGTGKLFLRETPGSDYPTLTSNPEVPADNWNADATCVDAMLLSLESLDSVIDGHPLTGAIDELNTRKNNIFFDV